MASPVSGKPARKALASPLPRVTFPRRVSSVHPDPVAPALPPSEFLSAASDFKLCTHANVVNLEVVRPRIVRPLMWCCSEPSCGSRADIVVCLTCAWMGCGRDQPGKHGLTHFTDTGHALTMQLSTGETFCYSCDEWVVNDNFKGDIKVGVCV